ncbi:MAG: DUF86 domain-containing protein [Deltaproteobacteria bacterium]|nr:DUF86 domain-containing protein [Deltaproteobacteria bacterium]
MLNAAEEAIKVSYGKTKQDIEKERLLNLALVRLIEIVGEAASRVSAAGCSNYRGIPWGKIIGMRNKLIHGYDNIDFDILYKTLTEDLPPLISELQKILGPGSTP